MAINHFKRRVRRILKNSYNWAKVIQLTFEGNHVEKRSVLEHAEHPVLLLHGFGSTRKTLSLLERRLRRDGYTVLSIRLGGVFDTFNSNKIEELAIFVRDKIERLYERHQFTGKMSIVGHSKGGLIGRYYLQCLDGASRVQHLITLGTPHNGSLWALIGAMTPVGWVMKSVKQMTPYSPLIKMLQKIPFPEQVRMTSIYSTQDMITPFPSAVVELGAASPNIKNISVDHVGHGEFLIKKSVYGHIKRALRDGCGKIDKKPLEAMKGSLHLLKTA